MQAFATFIESDTFFPILIALLVLLVLVFVWVIFSSSNDKKRQKNREIAVDEGVEIKIVKEEVGDGSVPSITIEDEPINVETIPGVKEFMKDTPVPDGEPLTFEEPGEVKLVLEEQPEMSFPKVADVHLTPEVAFGASPSEQKDINEDIVIPEIKEYTGEKTEIFDFPDFSNIENITEADDNLDDLTEPLKNVEDDVIEAANRYIESVMAGK